MPEKPQRGEVLAFSARDLPARSSTGGREPVTPREILDQGYELHAYCGHCSEWRMVNLQHLIRIGQANRPITGRRLVCRHCHEEGSGQLKRSRSPRR